MISGDKYTILIVLGGVFTLAFLLQLWYYLGLFKKLAFFKKTEANTAKPPVSVIICARNEEKNLIAFLPSVLNQQYHEYEVIVVNDCSFDHTDEILEDLARKHKNFRVITIKEDDNHPHGKKFALMVGIKGAKYEHLLLTDADCKPVSANWISLMMRNYTTETEIVLGYGAYEKKPGLLNKLIRFDTFYIALQYFSFSLANKTYMGIGRNLSYKRSLFFKHKGFASHYHIASGDDDLFINEAATKSNTKIEVDPDSFTVSQPQLSLKDWVRQKRRHITSSQCYNQTSKMRLLWLHMSQYIFFILAILLILFQFHPYQVYVVLSVLIIRYTVQLIIFKKSMNILHEKDLFLLSPVYELFFLFFYPTVSALNLFVKQDKWKR